MTPAEIAWTAGIYEGEGTITLSKGRWVVIKVAMTDREPVERLHRMWGGNFGTHRRAQGDRRKHVYRWELAGIDACDEFITAIEEWLSPRRIEQAARCIGTAIVQQPGPRPTSPSCGRKVKGYAGVNWHRRRGEPPCANCRQAATIYKAQRRAAGLER
jgi:hypothetical protein